jgi:hypothetical protein
LSAIHALPPTARKAKAIADLEAQVLNALDTTMDGARAPANAPAEALATRSVTP